MAVASLVGWRGVAQADGEWNNSCCRAEAADDQPETGHTHTHMAIYQVILCLKSISLPLTAVWSSFDALSPIHIIRHILIWEELILHVCHSVPIWLISCFPHIQER